MRPLLSWVRKRSRRFNKRFWSNEAVLRCQRLLRGVPYNCIHGASREFSLFTKCYETDMMRYSHGMYPVRSQRNYWPESKKACAVLQFMWTPARPTDKLKFYCYHAVFVEQERLLHSCALHPCLTKSRTDCVMWEARSHLLTDAVRPAIRAALSLAPLTEGHCAQLCTFVAECMRSEKETAALELSDLDSLTLIGVDTAIVGSIPDTGLLQYIISPQRVDH